MAIGDVITLFHSETEGNLCATGDINTKVVNVHKTLPGQRNSNHLFAISNPDPDKRHHGAFLQPGDVFRLLNLATAQFLAIQMPQDQYAHTEGGKWEGCLPNHNVETIEYQEDVRAYPLRLCAADEPDIAYSYFTFKATSAKLETKTIEFGPFYSLAAAGYEHCSIRVTNDYFYGVKVIESGLKVSRINNEYETQSKDGHNRMVMRHQSHALEFRIGVHAYVDQEQDQENTFRMTKVEPDFVNDVMFATSMIFYLEEFIIALQDREEGGATFLAHKVSEQGGVTRREFVSQKQRKLFQETTRALVTTHTRARTPMRALTCANLARGRLLANSCNLRVLSAA
jgi:hypothetical protein